MSLVLSQVSLGDWLVHVGTASGRGSLRKNGPGRGLMSVPDGQASVFPPALGNYSSLTPFFPLLAAEPGQNPSACEETRFTLRLGNVRAAPVSQLSTTPIPSTAARA